MVRRLTARLGSQSQMSIEFIERLEDPRLDPYRHLRTSNLTRFSGRFIAESKPLVQRLIASDLAVESVLVDEKYREEALRWIPESVTMLVIESNAISELIGFHFHRGYLACGLRPRAEIWNAAQVSDRRIGLDANSDWTGVYLIGVQDPENMGSILRSCAALGIQDILLGPDCVDPFARRVLRVSMGNAFKLCFFEARNVPTTLEQLHDAGIETVAACLSPSSVELGEWKRGRDTMLLLGNEAHGLPSTILEQVTRQVKIRMDLGTDSLNVSVAAGIFLHFACRLSIVANQP